MERGRFGGLHLTCRHWFPGLWWNRKHLVHKVALGEAGRESLLSRSLEPLAVYPVM